MKAKSKPLVDGNGVINLPYVRHPLDRPHLVSETGGESKTEQSHKDTVNINRIMSRVERHGILPVDPLGRVPNYGDVSHLNLPFDELLLRTRDVNDRIVKYTRAEKEKIRLERIKKREAMEAKAAAYDAHLAAVGKNNTTESQSS